MGKILFNVIRNLKYDLILKTIYLYEMVNYLLTKGQ